MTTDTLNVEQFVSETSINEANIDDAFQKQSSLRAYYGAMAADRDAASARAKLVCDVLEAKLYKKLRDEAAEAGTKTTEAMLSNAVKLSPEWIKAKQAYIEAERQADVCRSFVASLNDRRDMLIQLGADRRDEGKGQMRMMMAQQEADRLTRIRETARNAYQG